MFATLHLIYYMADNKSVTPLVSLHILLYSFNSNSDRSSSFFCYLMKPYKFHSVENRSYIFVLAEFDMKKRKKNVKKRKESKSLNLSMNMNNDVYAYPKSLPFPAPKIHGTMAYNVQNGFWLCNTICIINYVCAFFYFFLNIYVELCLSMFASIYIIYIAGIFEAAFGYFFFVLSVSLMFHFKNI